MGWFWDFNEKHTTETQDPPRLRSLEAFGFPESPESFLKLEKMFRGFKMVRSILSDSGDDILRGGLQAGFGTSTKKHTTET